MLFSNPKNERDHSAFVGTLFARKKAEPQSAVELPNFRPSFASIPAVRPCSLPRILQPLTDRLRSPSLRVGVLPRLSGHFGGRYRGIAKGLRHSGLSKFATHRPSEKEIKPRMDYRE